jgi:hypothetical protein
MRVVEPPPGKDAKEPIPRTVEPATDIPHTVLAATLASWLDVVH